MPGIGTVYRWELRKLRAQKRTYLGLGAAAAVPIIFVVAVATRGGGPNDVAFGRYVHDTGPRHSARTAAVRFGLVVPAYYRAGGRRHRRRRGSPRHPEDDPTRSVEREQIFAAKTLAAFTYAVLAILITGVVALGAGILASGFNPITSLSGTRVSATSGLRPGLGQPRGYLVPVLSIACIGLLFSTVFRNSGAAIVGTLMFSLLLQLIGILPGLGGLSPYLLSTQFNAWQGFLRTPIDWAPIVRALWVCALYGIPALAVAAVVFLRRDVAGD